MNRLIVLALVAAPLFAQPGMIPPPKQLDRLAPMMGRWEGTGEFFVAPGAEPMPWTSVSHIRKVFGGHCIRDENTVTLGPDGVVGTLGFIAHYHWDAEGGKIVSTTVGNMGQLDRAELRWVDDKTIVTVGAGWEEGRRTLERWTTVIEDGKQIVKGEKAIDGSPMFLHVQGTLVKKDGPPPELGKVGAFMATPSEHIEKMARMNGRYAVKGSYRMAPGQKLVSWSGHETIESLFGGMVIHIHSTGNEGYEGFGAFVWDPTRARYRSFHCSTMGMAHTSDHWLVDKQHLVSMTNMTLMGQPMIYRYAITLDEKGRPTKGEGHSIGASGPPFESMTATYEVQGAAGGRKGN